MYTVFLAGGIASGKSSAARLAESRGACRIDLDDLSREVLQAGSPCVEAVAREFGDDLVDGRGELDRARLAERAFASPEDAARLEAIELPYIKALLADRITFVSCANVMPDACVVEVPLLDRIEDMLPLADEVVAVTCPLALRRRRAVDRGMTIDDFDARVENQPDDAYLASKATFTIPNEGSREQFEAAVSAWWDGVESRAGRRPCGQ